MDADAVIVFTDIRGFTKWATDTEVFSHLEEFVRDFMALLEKNFAGCLVKPLGDGAMIVREIAHDATSEQLLDEWLQAIEQTKDEFRVFCTHFNNRIGHSSDLQLGWSVVRGKVRKLENDYVGPNINKAARLCDIARPFGIVIDRDDFPNLSPNAPALYDQKRRLPGIDNVRVWVTENIQNQFLPREQLREQPEVHIAGVCFRKIGARMEILLSRRASQRNLYPNLWAVPGGQLSLGETFAEGVLRHFQRELVIDVRVLEHIHCFYEISGSNLPLIPGIRFLCEWKSGEAQISLTSPEVRWVSESELKQMKADEFVPGLQREIAQLLKQFKAASRT